MIILLLAQGFTINLYIEITNNSAVKFIKQIHEIKLIHSIFYTLWI
jgi:hypothetical protein